MKRSLENNPRRVKSKKFYKLGNNKNANLTFWDTNIKIKKISINPIEVPQIKKVFISL